MASRAGIRSFVLRQGRLTRGQGRALAEEWQGFGLESNAGLINPATIFGNHHPLTFEMGFGMGESLITQAQTYPERNFIGVEVHRPGLGICSCRPLPHRLRISASMARMGNLCSSNAFPMKAWLGYKFSSLTPGTRNDITSGGSSMRPSCN